MELVIREATIGDFPALCVLFGEADQLHHDALPGIFGPPVEPPRPRDWLSEVVANPDQFMVVASVGERVVGLLRASLRQRHPPHVPEQFVVVDEVIVAARNRGAGIGRALMSKAESWAKARGAASIWLDVWAFNEGAIGFYDALGYENVALRLRKEIPS